MKINLRLHNVVPFAFGISIVIWLNAIMKPEFIVVLLFPQLFPLILIQHLVIPASVYSVATLLLIKYVGDHKSTWFFLGASSMSLIFAGQSLVQIAIHYYINVGQFPFPVEGYSYPAIYMFKLFRSIFLATLFGILGYWIEILKSKKTTGQET